VKCVHLKIVVGDLRGLVEDLVKRSFKILNVAVDRRGTYVYLEDHEEKDPGPVVLGWTGRPDQKPNTIEYQKRIKAAVVTMVIGDQYKRIAEVTHPTLVAYASRIGADFVVIRERYYSKVPTGYEKLQIGRILENYDRVIYLDTDVIVRNDTPNLLWIVPEWFIGVYNESDPTWESRIDVPGFMPGFCNSLRLPMPDYRGRYFNTGVMVVGRKHSALFTAPTVFPNCHGEQGYLNIQIHLLGYSILELPSRFNRIPDCLYGDGTDAYIIHYLRSRISIETLLHKARKDKDSWRERGLLGH